MIINRAFGIPLLSYYDDFGSIAPESIGQAALATIHSASKAISIILHDDKSEVGRRVEFLGLIGPFLNREEAMSLSISHPDAKRDTCSAIADAAAASGSIAHRDLENY